MAREVARLVDSARPGTVVDHVAALRCPGLPGKDIVDLAVEAMPDEIPPITDALRSLGFGSQGGLASFPPTRPMLIGQVVHEGSPFRVHLHVMPPARRELAELLGFRDALRTDAALRDAYADAKRAIVGDAPAGVSNGVYTDRKGGFVEDALYALGLRRPPADTPEPLAPGATIGILGGGQLGRMLGIAARAMGYRIVALDPDPACPAAAVADEIVVGRYDDADAARRLAALADVVTYELEHVGLGAAVAAAGRRPAPSRSHGARGHAGPARRAPVHPLDRGVDGALARGPRRRPRPRPPRARSVCRSGSRPRSAATTAGARCSWPRWTAWRPASRRSAAPTAGRCSPRRRSTSSWSCRSSAPVGATAGCSCTRSRATCTTRASWSRASRPPPWTR